MLVYFLHPYSPDLGAISIRIATKDSLNPVSEDVGFGKKRLRHLFTR